MFLRPNLLVTVVNVAGLKAGYFCLYLGAENNVNINRLRKRILIAVLVMLKVRETKGNIILLLLNFLSFQILNTLRNSERKPSRRQNRFQTRW